MKRNHDLIDVTVVIRHETAAAILVDHGDKTPCWLPRSQVEIAPNSDGKTHTVTLPEWLAEEKAMI